MTPDTLQSTVRSIVEKLSRADYNFLAEPSVSSRLSANDLKRAIDEYGQRLVPPPSDVYLNLDAVHVRDSSASTWSVRVPLWTQEEGRSDLTLELTVTFTATGPSVTLDDLHVL
jgi:hypothetical protein